MYSFLEVGDWSKDGHNQSSLIMVKHNLMDDANLCEAYKMGSKQLSFELENDVCNEYEMSWLTREQFDELSVQFDMSEYATLEQDRDDPSKMIATLHDNDISFAGIWMEIARMGNDCLEYEIIDIHNRAIHIGGYGLFYN